MARIHRTLLPLEEVDFGAGGFGARIEPYRSEITRGERVQLAVTIKNPFRRVEKATVSLTAPASWVLEPVSHEVSLEPLEEKQVAFELVPSPAPVRRARIAAELCVGGRDFGQQAEALVTVL
jgi:hypothetical protein